MRLFLDGNVVFSVAHLAHGGRSICGSRYFVTGDVRDFGRLYGRTLRGVRVVTPAAALAAVLESA